MLSINVRQASLVSSDGNWQTAFTELTPADLVMRKLLSVSDLTVCLDKRGAMGKIESYEVGDTPVNFILKLSSVLTTFAMEFLNPFLVSWEYFPPLHHILVQIGKQHS